MGFPLEYDPNRRRLILHDIPLVIGALLLTPSFLSCENQEQPKTKEKIDLPQPGDILILEGRPYLLRNQKLYLIPDLEKYKKFSKLTEYGRKIFSPPRGSLVENYPVGKISQERKIFDPLTGTDKTNKQNGGEMLLFFSGFLTDGGLPWEIIKPAEETFVSMLAGLKPQKWGLDDSFFFSYGKKRLGQYSAKDTTRSPRENIENALSFFEDLKEEFPLVQFNVIGHSLGAIFALEAARKHYDAINNLILINGPIRGLEASFLEKMAVKLALKPALMPFIGGEEKVTDYLFEIWEDKDYQKKLEEFVRFFTSIGKKMTIITDEADPIVPQESAVVKGAEIASLSNAAKPAISLRDLVGIGISKMGVGISEEDLAAAMDMLKAHGRPLKDEEAIRKIGKIIGEDLADVA